MNSATRMQLILCVEKQLYPTAHERILLYASNNIPPSPPPSCAHTTSRKFLPNHFLSHHSVDRSPTILASSARFWCRKYATAAGALAPPTPRQSRQGNKVWFYYHGTVLASRALAAKHGCKFGKQTKQNFCYNYHSATVGLVALPLPPLLTMISNGFPAIDFSIDAGAAGGVSGLGSSHQAGSATSCKAGGGNQADLHIVCPASTKRRNPGARRCSVHC